MNSSPLHAGNAIQRSGDRRQDTLLIKDNHLAVISDVHSAIVKIRKKYKKTKLIEIEVDNLMQFRKILNSDVDIILLDNFSLRFFITISKHIYEILFLYFLINQKIFFTFELYF